MGCILFQLVGWLPSPLGVLPFVALLTVVWARDVVFSVFQVLFFLPEFWELESLGKPVNKDLAGNQGCRIVWWLGDCSPVLVRCLKI